MIEVNEFMQLGDDIVTELFNSESYYALDTESSNNNEKAWVYAWSIGCTKTDVQVYGNNIDDIYSVFERIARANNKKYDSKRSQTVKFQVFVHNLKWDFEFLKYSFHRMGFEQFFGNVKYGKKFGTLQRGTFSVVCNDNIVYSANIKLHDGMHFVSDRKNRKGEFNSQDIDIEIELIDSMKITQKKLSDIADELLVINDMHKKLDGYDHKIMRMENHSLTDEEKAYLYNDVYILKEWAKQFYAILKTTKKTASSIAFEKFLEKTFRYKNFADNYKVFEGLFPDLTKYALISKIIEDSYNGGMTQSNRAYVHKTIKTNKAVSMDINSSYPAVVKNCMLPYGTPTFYSKGRPTLEEKIEDNVDMELITIAFDGFKNNNPNDLIGNIKVGDNVFDYIDSGAFEDFDIRGSQYIHTNIVDGLEINDVITDYELIGEKNPTDKRRYTMSIWSFELENLLENMSFYIEDKKWNKEYEEWDTVEVLRKGYDVLHTVGFAGRTGIFEEAVDFYTKMKIEAKLSGNKCLEEFAKMILNSFYGVMGSNSRRVDKSYKVNENGEIVNGEVVNVYSSSKKYYKAFASAVTAWARVNLRKTLYSVGFENVLYFDTDSLYTTLNKEELEERCGDLLHDTELGKWKIERTYNEFKTIGAKKYILKTDNDEIVCKCSGLPADVREAITFEQFELGASFEGKRQPVPMYGGFVLKDVPFRISDNIFD